MIPDKLKKTIRIPIRIQGGNVVLPNGKSLPEIEDGAVGEMVLDEFSVIDEEYIVEEQHDLAVEILSIDSEIFLGFTNIEDKYIDKIPCGHKLSIFNEEYVVPVKLCGSLWLNFRGSKSPMLEPCECYIPILEKKAKSLNHAYTMISTEIQPDRISHTGNVFTHGWVRLDNKWRNLNSIREQKQLELVESEQLKDQTK